MDRQLIMCGAAASLLALSAAASTAQAASPPTPSAMDYVTTAGRSDAFEIQEGQLAEERAKSPAVKRFGAEMVKDHSKSTQIVLDAAAKSGLAPMAPPLLSAEQQQNLAALQAAAPAAFDGIYLHQQDKAHQDALQLHELYESSGSDKNLRHAAAQIVPVVQMHVSMISTLESGQ